jgi:hypothetical protein
VDAAVWGFIGVVVGAVLTGVFGLFRDRALIDERERERGAAAAKSARDERKEAYVQLLLAARQLRYAARPASAIDPARVEALKADLSSAQYLIELLATPRLINAGDRLRRAVLDYVNEPPGADKNKRDLLRARAGAHVEHFTLLARIDLASNEAG